ncbi:MAG: hypothetical protein JWM05_2084 [Acidimicrobiales bacterium]|nr:hypothetical protein [Acidimicrobiales bacterium]
MRPRVAGSRRRAAAAGVVVAAVAALLTGCGIPRDRAPHEISDKAVQDLVSPSTGPTTTAANGAARQSVYFLRDGRLEEVRIRVDNVPTAEQALALLLAGPSDAQASQGFTSTIPPGTELLGVTLKAGVLRVNLSSEMNGVGGRGAKSAYAQLVFTSLSFRDVAKVRFFIDGKAVEASTDDGAIAEVGPSNYDPPLNPR